MMPLRTEYYQNDKDGKMHSSNMGYENVTPCQHGSKQGALIWECVAVIPVPRFSARNTIFRMFYAEILMRSIMSPLRRGGGHIVFGVDPVGVGVAFCLHNIS